MKGRFLAAVLTVVLYGQLAATLPTKEEAQENKKRVDALLEAGKYSPPKCVSVPEQGFVYAFHPKVTEWAAKPFTEALLEEIATELKPHLKLTLTKEGFAPASTHYSENESDPTGYNAIWVRDCVWQYWALKIQDQGEARRLALALLKFYSTPDQIKRFQNVIANPCVADPTKNPNAAMDVPLIKFSSQTLSFYKVDGKVEAWNHLQFDSHGLFLLLVADALSSEILSSKDLTPKEFEVLSLFPPFFARTQYWDKPDAGPWEEELLWNASSAGIIASGLKQVAEAISKEKGLERLKGAYNESAIKDLVDKGLARVERDLRFGGEAPNITGKSLQRGADAALLFLCTPATLIYADNPARIKEILHIDSSLIGPYGIQRYAYDAYQAANFWTVFGVPSPIVGDATLYSLFATRLNKGFTPAQNSNSAQWFFDSVIAQIYYALSQLETEMDAKRFSINRGDLHLKRALGQLTGTDAYAGNGERLPPFQLAESINTLIDSNGRPLPAPSPICPLGWAKASLQMALDGAQKAHSEIAAELPPTEKPPKLDFKSL